MKRIVPALTVLSLVTGSAGAATPTIERDTYLSLHLTAAVDSNCNGELAELVTWAGRHTKCQTARSLKVVPKC